MSSHHQDLSLIDEVNVGGHVGEIVDVKIFCRLEIFSCGLSFL